MKRRKLGVYYLLPLGGMKRRRSSRRSQAFEPDEESLKLIATLYQQYNGNWKEIMLTKKFRDLSLWKGEAQRYLDSYITKFQEQFIAECIGGSPEKLKQYYDDWRFDFSYQVGGPVLRINWTLVTDRLR